MLFDYKTNKMIDPNEITEHNSVSNSKVSDKQSGKFRSTRSNKNDSINSEDTTQSNNVKKERPTDRYVLWKRNTTSNVSIQNTDLTVVKDSNEVQNVTNVNDSNETVVEKHSYVSNVKMNDLHMKAEREKEREKRGPRTPGLLFKFIRKISHTSHVSSDVANETSEPIDEEDMVKNYEIEEVLSPDDLQARIDSEIMKAKRVSDKIAERDRYLQLQADKANITIDDVVAVEKASIEIIQDHESLSEIVTSAKSIIKPAWQATTATLQAVGALKLSDTATSVFDADLSTNTNNDNDLSNISKFDKSKRKKTGSKYASDDSVGQTATNPKRIISKTVVTTKVVKRSNYEDRNRDKFENANAGRFSESMESNKQSNDKPKNEGIHDGSYNIKDDGVTSTFKNRRGIVSRDSVAGSRLHGSTAGSINENYSSVDTSVDINSLLVVRSNASSPWVTNDPMNTSRQFYVPYFDFMPIIFLFISS